MAEYRRQFDESARHSWFDDRNSRYETDRTPNDDRASRWEGGSEDRAYGMFRTDDRAYHDRFRDSQYRESNRDDAVNDYYRAARDQRDDEGLPSWLRRERGGYWRQYEAARPHFIGRGPKGYKRSDDRIREEICDRMTDDPLLDASEIEVEVTEGEVTLRGAVTSRDQKRRAEDIADAIGGVKDVTNQLRVTRDGGHSWAPDSSRASGPGITSSQPVSEASGKGTPSKSTTGTTA